MSTVVTKILYVSLFAVPPILSLFYSYYISFRSSKSASDEFIKIINETRNEYHSNKIFEKDSSPSLENVKSKNFIISQKSIQSDFTIGKKSVLSENFKQIIFQQF